MARKRREVWVPVVGLAVPLLCLVPTIFITEWFGWESRGSGLVVLALLYVFSLIVMLLLMLPDSGRELRDYLRQRRSGKPRPAAKHKQDWERPT
jgi:hypothetical protein